MPESITDRSSRGGTPRTLTPLAKTGNRREGAAARAEVVAPSDDRDEGDDYHRLLPRRQAERMSKSPWEPEATELRESVREIGYLIYRDVLPFKWLVRKLGMQPKHWIREREERDAQSQDTKPQ